jgi:FAD-dependent oxidoreductase domain-containing protein 1
VHAMRRQVCIFDCREVDLTPYGMMIDTSGVYFHPEATNGLAGFATPGEPAGINYEYDGEGFFTDIIWPALYERSSKFERLKHVTGWAGLYEVSPDECAVIGQVQGGEAARSGRIFEAHSFSGHGVMHSHSAGLAMAELLVTGRYQTLDVSSLSAARFESGQLLHEGLVI